VRNAIPAYVLSKSILEKIWLERLRQKQLLREGRIFFACDSTVVSHDRKLRVLVEEIGEVAHAIGQIEILNPLRKPRAALSEQSVRARRHLRDELVQVASVVIAWLESLEEEK
jgi:NTP pyrophosphatase (non-canonical NTP hydrolase)